MRSTLRLLLLSLLTIGQAMAGNILFVNYNGSDAAIATALTADGHVVTSANVDPATASAYFQGANLGQYCAVVWSAAYAYNQNVSGAATVLSNWVTAGGHVLITTPDGIRNDGTLVGLLGGAGGTDQGTNLSAVANVSNSVTTGRFDIRGQQPPNVSDMDALCSPLTAGTVGLVTAQNTQCSTNHQDPGYAWTLRTLGAGEVAFITSGNFSSGPGNTPDPDWTATAIPGDGVYNAGLRNFAYASCLPHGAAVPASSSPQLLVMALLVAAAGLLFRAVRGKS